jgi:TonB-dependent Receptor Plug Domain/CarboxypepD_reg-like domain
MKIKRITGIIFILFLGVQTISAQTRIHGKVVDRRTNEPIANAVVKDTINGSIAVADENGWFSILRSDDSVRLTITGIGYETLTAVYRATDALTISLVRGAVRLNELVLYSGINNNNASTAVSKIDLHVRPVRSGQELLRNVPGLFVAQHQGGGKAEQIFLRGFDIDHGTDVSIQVDGMPVNLVSHAHGQGYADLHFLIPELVKTIDYGKGPYYGRYGNFGTAGYVQFETRAKLERGVVQAEVGRFSSGRLLALVPLLDKTKQDAYIAAELVYSDGPFQRRQGFNRLNLQSRYNAVLSPKTRLSVMASVFNSRWDASGQVPERAVAQGLISRFGEIDHESGYTSRANLNVKTHHRINNNAQLENQVYYSRYGFNLFSNFTFFLNDPVNGDQIRQREKRDLFGIQSTYTLKQYYKDIRLTHTVSTGFRQDNTYSSELSKTRNRSIVLARQQLGNVQENNTWAYATTQIGWGNWLLTAALRGDYFHFRYQDLLQNNTKQQQKGVISPKLSLQYQWSKNLQLYVKTGRGFHSNDTRVVVDTTVRQTLPPVYGGDLGLVWKPLPSLMVTAAAWYLHSAQEFVYVGDEGIVEPGGASRRNGIDLGFRYQLSKHWFADADLNWSNARTLNVPKTENRIPLAPVFTSTGGIHYQAKTGFTGSLRYRYLKDRPANEDASITAKGYFVADAVVNYAFKKMECGIAIENVLNTKWNEAQFATTTRLRNETDPVTELHFTPGTPFFIKARVALYF